MQNRYKVIIANRFLYKEVELSADAQRMVVGTGIDSDVRLHKAMFFEPVELIFLKGESGWSVICSDNMYLTVGDIRKLMTKKLEHGDVLEVKYQQSNNLVFNVEFVIDFDDGKRKYERAIDISGAGSVTIGADKGSSIVLGSVYTTKEAVELKKNGENYTLNVLQTRYGVYHNGRKVSKTSLIRNGDFLSLSDFSFYLKDGALWTHIREDMRLNGLRFQDHVEQNAYPLFKRNTRIKTAIEEEKISILDPAAVPEKPKNNILMRLLPSMGMLLAAGVMAFKGGGMIIMSLISGGMAIVTSILALREQNKDYNEAVAKRISTYDTYVKNKRLEIQGYREEERKTLERLYIDQNAEKSNFASFSSNLFDRTKDDEDFLCVRVGTGAVEAVRTIDYKRQDKLEPDDELQMIPEKLSQEFKYISEAPVTFDMKAVNAVGVYGSEENCYSLLKNLVVDIAARQYFSDVKMVFVAQEQNKERIHWLRMLPHAYNENIGTRNIVCNSESKNLIFEYLYKEMTIREQNKKYDNRIVVFFYDDYGFHSHPISKFVDKAKDLGITLVFFGRKRSDIPLGCGYLLELNTDSTGKLIDTANDTLSKEFHYPSIADADAKRIVEILAPVYTEEISLEGTLTKNYSMFEMLNIIAVDDLDLTSRWASTQVFKSMAAPIGTSKTGMVYLDLHDKAHGPHGLVAGTTGSGKSEILQTYILAMATLFAPSEVGFVIIDFKGGGMVNQFKDLPHLMGAITNIDGKQINRSLKSIKAELQKRQRYFADADVNHIDKYIKKFKAGEVSEPLPHLIIIVDEFAELKAEQPEFMKELISAARIGRSLGVHLILATQKPSGQVNEQIWSNSRFKLCLKVASQQDSNEVIKSPLAAEIKEPGRAYLQVGNNEIFELFQSAYSGGSEKADDSGVKEFSVYNLSDSGKRVPVYTQKKKKGGDGGVTQLDAIVNYIHEYCEGKNIKKLPDICLPALEEVIDFPTAQKRAEGVDIVADIGVFDDPDNQYQGQFSVNLTNQNLMIIGSSQSGKTNLLQTIIRSVSTKYTPDEVSIYVLDFASMVLKNFDKLNHVGGVVTASEDEKLKNLFKLLNTEIETRKEKLISVGVSSFSAYKEAGKTDLPQILLIIDNLTALKELYFQDDDVLLGMCREGLSVGISIIIANSQTAGIGYKYLSNFSGRIALFCNDSNEYNSLFDHCSERLDNIPGRSIVDIEKRHLECHTYLAFKGEKEFERVADIRAFITATNAKNRGKMARIIPVIPASLNERYIEEQFGNYMQTRFQVVAGLDYGTVSPYLVDFANLGMVAITGREKSGKHNWLRYSMGMLYKMYEGKLKVYAVDSIGKKLASMKTKPYIAAYSILAEDAPAYIKEMEKELKRRYDALVAGDESVIATSDMLVLILDSADAVTAICNDRDALNAYKNIIGRYKNTNACIIFSALENAAIPYSAPEIFKNLRDSRHMLYFDDLMNMKVFDVPLAMARKFKKPIEQGDCYYIKDNECVKLKTPVSFE